MWSDARACFVSPVHTDRSVQVQLVNLTNSSVVRLLKKNASKISKSITSCSITNSESWRHLPDHHQRATLEHRVCTCSGRGLSDHTHSPPLQTVHWKNKSCLSSELWIFWMKFYEDCITYVVPFSSSNHLTTHVLPAWSTRWITPYSLEFEPSTQQMYKIDVTDKQQKCSKVLEYRCAWRNRQERTLVHPDGVSGRDQLKKHFQWFHPGIPKQSLKIKSKNWV